MHVKAFLKYGSQAASARHRLLQFVPYLREHGIEVETLPLLGNDHVARLAVGRGMDVTRTSLSYASRLAHMLSGSSADLYWIQYELFPYLPGFLEKLAVSASPPILLDYDDAIFHMYDSHRSRLVRTVLHKKLVPLMRRATVVTCGNRYIRAYASRFCADTPIIPTVVDTDIYAPAVPTPKVAPVIGWIGSPSTWRYVEPMLPLIVPLVERHGWRFRAIGAGPRAEGIEGVDAIPWSETTEVSEIQGMDIGIMPVPDDRWARGKCGFKLIQYMACSLPVVASPVGVNCEIVRPDNGFLAVSAAEWVSSLETLMREPTLRRQMGENGRSQTVTSYSMQSQQPHILEAFRRAAAKPG